MKSRIIVSAIAGLAGAVYGFSELGLKGAGAGFLGGYLFTWISAAVYLR